MSKHDEVEKVANLLPGEFGLKGFPGETFRVNLSKSSTRGDHVLFTVERAHDGGWEKWNSMTLVELLHERARPEKSHKRGAGHQKLGRYKTELRRKLKKVDPAEASGWFKHSVSGQRFKKPGR